MLWWPIFTISRKPRDKHNVRGVAPTNISGCDPKHCAGAARLSKGEQRRLWTRRSAMCGADMCSIFAFCEMRRRLDHAPCIARRAHPVSLAGEGDEEVVPAVNATSRRELMGKDAALQVAAKLALDMARDWVAVLAPVASEWEPGREVGLHGAIEQRAIGPSQLVDELSGGPCRMRHDAAARHVARQPPSP